MDFSTGHVKHNPVTNEVAVRTIFPDDETFGDKAWCVATTNVGSRSAKTVDVEGWDDVFVPDEGLGS